jgi:hypothetical protein
MAAQASLPTLWLFSQFDLQAFFSVPMGFRAFALVVAGIYWRGNISGTTVISLGLETVYQLGPKGNRDSSRPISLQHICA